MVSKHALVKLVITWFVYRLVIRNAVSILMMAHCNGSDNFFDKLRSEFFYIIGFVISSLSANYLLIFLDGLFLKLGTSLAVILVQIAAYGIFTVGIVLIIAFILTKRFFQRTIIGAIIEGFVKLLFAASFFMFIHYFKTNQAVSYQLGVIIVIAIGITL